MVINSLREEKFSLRTTPFIFVGGGAVVMKNFGNFEQNNFSFITDVCINAKGFQLLADFALKEAE